MQRLPQQQQDFIYIPASLKAPLATFDTIDLGDEDVLPVKASPIHLSASIQPCDQDTQVSHLPSNSPKIGGAQSKGRGGAGKAGTDPSCQSLEPKNPAQQSDETQPPTTSPEAEISDDEDVPTPTNHSPTPEVEDVSTQPPMVVGGTELETVGKSSSDPPVQVEEERKETEASAVAAQPLAIGKIQGNWVKHEDSDSSSSSGSGCDTFTFRPIKGSASASATQDDDDDDDDDTDYTPQTRRRLILREKSNDYSLNLYPDDLDPAQIASPSKRKAYEKRLQRLQVKTSPIVRPRSTTPISVVTLEEYISSSPDTPASPFQEKLKISLPNSEFSSKVKSPRSARKQSETQTESCFVFNEEILFSHTRSALVVDQVGHVPQSPRRVLIPPTLSPSTSPKLSRAAGLKSDSSLSTQLVYCEGEECDEIFGQPAAQENADWATFTEPVFVNPGDEACGGEEPHISLLPDSDKEGESDEILTVNIESEGPSKPSTIQVVLSAASSSTPSPSTPDSDEAIKAASSQTVITQDNHHEGDHASEPASRPPPIPPRRRPPPPPPPPQPPPDVVPEDDGVSELTSAKCDLLVDIDSQ